MLDSGLAAMAICCLLLNSAAAQLAVAPDRQDKSPDDSTGEVNVQVRRVVRLPASDVIRLLILVTEPSSSGRRLALAERSPLVIDDLGNIYEFSGLAGLQTCGVILGAWLSAHHCGNNFAKTTTMTPGVARPVVLEFVPATQTFSHELAALAESLSLTFRFALVSEAGTAPAVQDVIVAGIPLPRPRE